MKEHQCRLNHGGNLERGSAFILMLLLAFVTSAIIKNVSSTDLKARFNTANHVESQREDISRRFITMSDSLQNIAKEKGSAYSCADFIQARNALFALNDSMTQLGHNPSTTSYLLDIAIANCLANNQIYSFEMSRAEQTYGEPPQLTHDRAETGSRLAALAIGTIKHGFWFGFFVMPFLLLSRLVYHQRKSGWRSILEAIGPYLWWLLVCSLFWPFMSLRHADHRPRETMRFWYLRFRYLLAHHKLLLTVAEKEALLAEAGSAEQNIQSILAAVHTTARLATGRARGYAFAAFLSTLLPINISGTLATVMAQTATTAAADSVSKPKPKFSHSGFVISTITLDPPLKSPGGMVALNYFRLCPTIAQGNIKLSAVLDAVPPLHIKTAYIGYDMDPKLIIEIGRLASPFACWYSSPKNTPALYTPLTGLATPFFDNGVQFRGAMGKLDYRAGIFNGNGGYDDDNHRIDVSGQANMRFGRFSLGTTFQIGEQLSGYRSLYALNLKVGLLSDRLSLQGLVVERPDLRKNGMMSQIVFRDGPTEYIGLYEKSEDGQTADIGINHQATDELQIAGHAIFKTSGKPQYQLQTRFVF
jgi:hypothetical protein